VKSLIQAIKLIYTDIELHLLSEAPPLPVGENNGLQPQEHFP